MRKKTLPKMTVVSAAALVLLAGIFLITALFTGKRGKFPEKVSVFFPESKEIVIMDGSEFLTGCVRGWIPRGEIPPEDALEAVAAAVKCKALYCLENGNSEKGLGADFVAGEDFPYVKASEKLDISAEITEALKKAPELSAGKKPFDAQLCGISTGVTDECENSPSAALLCDMSAKGYESISAYTPEEVRRAMGVNYCPADPAEWFSNPVYAESGTLVSTGFCGRTFSGEEIRSRLGLRSAAASLEFREDKFYFTCHGSGCNRGMSVNAAIFFAREGRNAEEILKLFYYN